VAVVVVVQVVVVVALAAMVSALLALLVPVVFQLLLTLGLLRNSLGSVPTASQIQYFLICLRQAL
jgi:hypothetical protein